jgi:hypothetical protein
MAKRVLLCLSHSIEEHDQLKLLAGLGYEVASIGGYIDPANPHDSKRPALDIPCYPDLKEAIDSQGVDDNLGAAQAYIPDAILDWLGADGIIIYHHYLERLFGQWNHLFDWMAGGGRVIWRTVGQSTEDNERRARPFRDSGLEIVRYSPKEMHIPGFAGEDKLIRFYKDPLEWMGWTGEVPVVCNITQHLAQRHPWTNAMFFAEACGGLPTVVAGPGSEALPIGIGELDFPVMKELLQTSRAYLYTGTQPASYTLGLLEALMTGVPAFSIGPSHMKIFAYGHELFEGHELSSGWSDDPLVLRDALAGVLADGALAQEISIKQRTRAIAEFGIDQVGADWKAYLG